MTLLSSFLRKQEFTQRHGFRTFPWMPAFAGMTAKSRSRGLLVLYYTSNGSSARAFAAQQCLPALQYTAATTHLPYQLIRRGGSPLEKSSHRTI